MVLDALVRRVGEALERRGWMLVTAESCTGGGVAHAVTSVAGSSGWFDRGFVTYSNVSKRELLGVAEAILEEQGAVSEATVRAMVAGALEHSRGEIAVAVSGIAGPGGGSLDKPVGTVFMAWAVKGGDAHTRRYLFHGDREAVRRQAVLAALHGVEAILQGGAPAATPS